VRETKRVFLHSVLFKAYEENTRKRESEQRAAIMAEKRRLVGLSSFTLLSFCCFVLLFQAKSKAKETEGGVVERESGLDDIVTALHKNNLLRIRRDNQRAGFSPPPELQGMLIFLLSFSHNLPPFLLTLTSHSCIGFTQKSQTIKLLRQARTRVSKV